MHGDSTVCANVDVRQHPLVYPLTRENLNTFQEGGIVRCALAPFGLSGILNGISYKDNDNGAATVAFIQQWSKFYPLPKTLSRIVTSSNNSSNNSANSNGNNKSTDSAMMMLSNQNAGGSRSYLSNLTNMLFPPSNKPSMNLSCEPNGLPPVVEVIVAGHRMRYPTECIFTTSKVVDLYKSITNNLHPQRSTSSYSASKRFMRNSPTNKSNRLSLLSERLSEEKNAVKVKVEPDQQKAQSTDSPFRLVTSTSKGTTTGNQSSGKPDDTNPTSVPDNLANKDKNPNNGQDQDSSNNPLASGAQTTISRYNTTKLGYGSNNTSLGPTDLVKLFPTPPSLEQVVQSPAEETGTKELAPSPAAAYLTNNDASKDNGIDVYKPVEYALMPPPPKWAALTNIVISSSKSLPPQCIYKGTSQNSSSKELNRQINESSKGYIKTSASKQSNVTSDKKGPVASPLTDQTNKNGYNSLNPATPQTPSNILSNNSGIGPISAVTGSLTLTSTSSTTATTSSISSFTLPHQRLFNNLYEINSIQLNLLISDSALGMFQDHNFENCTLCVCNMSIKGFGPDSIPTQRPIDHNAPWTRQSLGSDSLIQNSGNESTNECTCGFSAITNRHCSHLSGLFLEDELEITNVLYDPTEMIDQNKLFRAIRLADYSEAALQDEQKLTAKLTTEMNRKLSTATGNEDSSQDKSKTSKQDDKSSHASNAAVEETKTFVIEQLKTQCSWMIHSNSSLSKVLLTESFRNDRHLTSCTNYYAQVNRSNSYTSPIYRLFDDSNKYTTVKLLNRNPVSLKFSDSCELAKNIIIKLGNQSQQANRIGSNSLTKSPAGLTPGLGSIVSRLFGSGRQSIMSKSLDNSSNRNNVFMQGLQALVAPTLAVDPKSALQMLEQLIKDDSREALATLNKAILIFSSPMYDWQFITAPVPGNNFDAANLLKVIQPMLDDAIGSHNKLYKDYVHQQQQHIFSGRDSPTGAPIQPTPPCQGPLTWRQFHQAAGRGTEDQCEPQPIPSLLVGHQVEKNHLGLSPFALKFWDKLLLEPYAPGHNLFYLVLAPDNQNIISHVNLFFRELSNAFELMKLGKHIPIGNGLVLANFNQDHQIDDGWFSKVRFDDRDQASGILTKLKSYAAKLDSTLAKTIVDYLNERQPPYDPHADRFDSSPPPPGVKNIVSVTNKFGQPQQQQQSQNHNRLVNSLLGPSGGSQSSQAPLNTTETASSISSNPFGASSGLSGFGSGLNTGLGGLSSLGISTSEIQAPNINTDQMSQFKSQALINSTTSHGNYDDTANIEDETNRQTGIVIYLIDPFSSPSMPSNLRTVAMIGLFKCYSMLLDQLPEGVRRICQVQLISLDSIVSHSRPISNLSRVDQLKSLSMNVYSQCRKIMTNQVTAKTMTGFGPAAALEAFFKTKNQDISVAKMFMPPFILAPMKDKQTELSEMFGDRREKSSVMFCSYCISEDQRWLIASATNDKGEMAETTVININIVDNTKRPKVSIKRAALRKLMEFIVTVMSDYTNPWRLIIGKLGRVGHGELKEWASIMSKRSLLSYGRILAERCRKCTLLPAPETVSILSACLVSLEPDSKLRIMPDQFTSDDRHASFNKCPLSTPEDASATHILVFPTSASIQSSHGNVEDPLAGSGLDDDLLNQFPLEDGMEELGVEENMDDLFSAWDDNPSDVNDNIGGSHHDTMMSSSNLQMGSVSGADHSGQQDETLQLLQQPLALGYYISTAKIGQMPNWFWSTSPHLRNSCPVFLKSALHIHMPCVHLSDDLLHSGVGQSRKTHQLDSNLTTDVLRYVLEGYNSLSWLALNPKTYDRQSCLPVHMQNLLQLYHLIESFS